MCVCVCACIVSSRQKLISCIMRSFSIIGLIRAYIYINLMMGGEVVELACNVQTLFALDMQHAYICISPLSTKIAHIVNLSMLELSY